MAATRERTVGWRRHDGLVLCRARVGQAGRWSEALGPRDLRLLERCVGCGAILKGR